MFFHILVLIEAIIEASGSALADLTIPECLDDSAAQSTAFSIIYPQVRSGMMIALWSGTYEGA